MALSIADTVLATAAAVRDLALSDPVVERWDVESSCAGMSVGGLAHHLTAQLGTTVDLLSAGPGDGEPIELREHYRRAAWANSGLDDEVNVSIREGSDQAAADGPGAVADRTHAWLAALPGVLGTVQDDTVVMIPWQGWALSAHDLVVTRLMEMVVHGDDLASSVGVETPVLPDEAVRLAIDLLAQVAVDRHGQAAVVRTLSRPQRAPESIAAF
ncbi:maleylpyruvate isomerase N-terminal domain-containing protein [Nocardioides sp. GXQ0305]|uniref:maleylpyruvate isomerase N-terminal domain-containing protein n=1 Tax=Nocardioides sp. GXQ0305 TaxID=3423912 RepID=UPI003D7D27EC